MSPRGGYGGGPGATPGSSGTLQEHLATLTAAASIGSAGDPAAPPFPPAPLQGSSSTSQGAAGGFAAVPPRPPRPLMETHAEVRATCMAAVDRPGAVLKILTLTGKFIKLDADDARVACDALRCIGMAS